MTEETNQGEHRHLVAGQLREFISPQSLRGGARVYCVPRDESTPRGAKLGMIPLAGMELAVNEYILGCAQRGAVRCYEIAAPAADKGK
jgi:hypothetical protein